MRATINFEVNADKVEETMATLVSQEAATLRIAANILDNLGDGPLLQEVNEAIDLLQEAATQLKQYQQMMLNFERSRFETIVPQPVPTTNDPAAPEPAGKIFNNLEELREQLQTVKDFQDAIQAAQEIDDEGEDVQSTEG